MWGRVNGTCTFYLWTWTEGYRWYGRSICPLHTSALIKSPCEHCCSPWVKGRVELIILCCFLVDSASTQVLSMTLVFHFKSVTKENIFTIWYFFLPLNSLDHQTYCPSEHGLTPSVCHLAYEHLPQLSSALVMRGSRNNMLFKWSDANSFRSFRWHLWELHGLTLRWQRSSLYSNKEIRTGLF